MERLIGTPVRLGETIMNRHVCHNMMNNSELHRCMYVLKALSVSRLLHFLRLSLWQRRFYYNWQGF